MPLALFPTVARARPAPMTDSYIRTLRAVWDNVMTNDATAAEVEMLVMAVGPALDELLERRGVMDLPAPPPPANRSLQAVR